MLKNAYSGARWMWMQIQSPSITSCVTLGTTQFLYFFFSPYFFLLNFFIEVYLIYDVSDVQQIDSFFFRFFSIISYYKILDIVP